MGEHFALDRLRYWQENERSDFPCPRSRSRERTRGYSSLTVLITFEARIRGNRMGNEAS